MGHCDRDWLVKSKELDRVFCIGKLLKDIEMVSWQMRGIMIGYILTVDLKSMRPADPVLNMTTWYDLHTRLQKYQTIDKAAQLKVSF